MTLKSNLIFDPDSSIEVFFDSIHEVESEHAREIMQWDASQVAETKTKARYRRPSVTQYAGKITTDIITNKRKLVYLNGYPDRNIVIDGGNQSAIYGNVDRLRLSDQNLSACIVEFVMTAKGGVTGQYFDSDDCASTGSQTSDSNAVEGYADIINASGEKVYKDLTQVDYELPAGDYKLFARVKDSAQVADDVKLEVYNVTDAGSIASDTFTATSGYTYVVLDFTTDSSEDGDTIRLSCEKATGSANSISVDFIGFVKV